ncbi:uncharacterized protein LOC142844092 [Microtus pennsylvanicus]|uniref:uncharacterized protein LOC142844092 n=1 Tax=Microtus pennsylvanicus TaxID=10058 RepID=UPI003F6D0957
MHSCLVRAQLGRNPETGDAPAIARCSLGCGRAPRPEPDCLVGEGEPHEISGAFSSPRGAGQLKSFWPQCLGPDETGAEPVEVQQTCTCLRRWAAGLRLRCPASPEMEKVAPRQQGWAGRIRVAGFGGRPGLPATFRQSGVAAALPALLLPGLIASEFPPTHTLPANLTLTSTRPARRGSSLTHWLPRGASPFLLLQFGDRSAAFQTIIPPCPCAHGAELLVEERCGSHAAGRCTFVFLSQAVGQRGDPGWRRPSIQEALCERMHEQRTDAAGARRLRAAQHLPAPSRGLSWGHSCRTRTLGVEGGADPSPRRWQGGCLLGHWQAQSLLLKMATGNPTCEPANETTTTTEPAGWKPEPLSHGRILLPVCSEIPQSDH